MNTWTRVMLLFIPSLFVLVLLGISFITDWWTIPLEQNLPNDTSLNFSNATRIYSTLIPITISHSLLSECVSYRNVKTIISNSFNFRTEINRDEQIKLLNENCTENQFICKTGTAILRPLTRCIDRQKQCNRIIDCEDKSDELFCDKNFQIADCPYGYVKCSDGYVCYRQKEQTCDGVINCIDESDEKDCNHEKCQLNKHYFCPKENKCSRRENSNRCDGIVDCEDNSDEENCQQCYDDKNIFLCDDKCFTKKHRCNGIVDCSDLRDELNCDDYSMNIKLRRNIYHKDRLCEERRLNPFHIHPMNFDSTLVESYSNPNRRIEYLKLAHYLKLFVFYGISGGILFQLLSIVSLMFAICCRYTFIGLPFYFYVLWTLLSWLFICVALLSFINLSILNKQILIDDERNLPLNIMIYRINRSLRYLEFFGLSFWCACTAGFITFIGLLLSCCICCTISSSRSNNKKYEIMHIQNS